MATPQEILTDFAQQIEDIFKEELEKIGLPERYPSGKPVRLWNSVKVIGGLTAIPDSDVNFLLELNDYAVWVVRGRRPKKQNPTAKPPPFPVILDWVKRRGFQFTRQKTVIDRVTGREKRKGEFLSFNETAWIVRNIILIKGVKGRDFITPAGGRVVKEFLNNVGNPLFASLFATNIKTPPFKTIPLITKK